VEKYGNMRKFIVAFNVVTKVSKIQVPTDTELAKQSMVFCTLDSRSHLKQHGQCGVSSVYITMWGKTGVK
jgi:hypothetical protein